MVVMGRIFLVTWLPIPIFLRTREGTMHGVPVSSKTRSSLSCRPCLSGDVDLCIAVTRMSMLGPSRSPEELVFMLLCNYITN